MLRANHRLLKPGGRIAFLVIEVAPDLETTDRAQAATAGPPQVASRSVYSSMMRSAGFVGIDRLDLTVDYRTTLTAWHDRYLEREDEVRAEFGDDLFEEKVSAAEGAIAATDAGVLQRALYVGSRRV